ncbi:1-aminocyclopropane-1-carboxylate deaminase [Leptospira ainlahdjerensis]|uniref:1-aminocyclopropane-1-carboxylate deaminase n=1 Tax=Leptospira ainlahdjerensis TaxID=2810033 RepID=UPI001E58B4A7|nr:1-aminocyclopropane-1-carboxylate deaminase [Leptospira ainlahdjerensis]
MNPLAAFLSSSLERPLEFQEVLLCSKQKVTILRDDRLAFGIGTKFRKFFGIHSDLENKGIHEVILQGELHSNLLASFSFLFRVFGYRVNTYSYSRDPKKVTFNSRIVKINSHTLKVFPSRFQWKEGFIDQKSNVAKVFEFEEGGNLSLDSDFSTIGDPDSSFKSHVLIPEYGFGPEAVPGLTSLWKQIPISNFNHLVIDIGSGLTWLAAKNFFGDTIPVHGVSIGLEKSKMIPWLQRKRRELKFSGFEIGQDSIWESEVKAGFGSSSPDLFGFCNSFFDNNSIPIEPIYSGKTLYTIRKRMEGAGISGKILYLHQGGLWNFLDSFLPRIQEKKIGNDKNGSERLGTTPLD